jgi:hypothetical protein
MQRVRADHDVIAAATLLIVIITIVVRRPIPL